MIAGDNLIHKKSGVPPDSLILSSTGSTSELHGDYLGEYQLDREEGRCWGRPVYKQKDNVESKTPYYLYYGFPNWYVSSTAF